VIDIAQPSCCDADVLGAERRVVTEDPDLIFTSVLSQGVTARLRLDQGPDGQTLYLNLAHGGSTTQWAQAVSSGHPIGRALDHLVEAALAHILAQGVSPTSVEGRPLPLQNTADES
jgi:hypothetical protein